MLSIQVNGDGHWIKADPVSLINLMLAGEVTELTPARDPARSEAVQPLIQLLQPRHLEELTRHVLELLPQMYEIRPTTIDRTTLTNRVAGLCTWNWPDPLIKGRLEWISAWLHELEGSFDKAVVLYGAYLREPAQDAGLRLLALNNLGVLRIRMGQVRGVEDIAQAAIYMKAAETVSSQNHSLPAACFNLLNLMNIALAQPTLRDQLEEALVHYFAGLPNDIREHWLGSEPEVWDTDVVNEDRFSSDDVEDFDDRVEQYPAEFSNDQAAYPAHETRHAAEKQRRHARLEILHDATYVRLNRLLVCLTEQAQKLAPNTDNRDFRDCVAAQLRLWTPRSVEDAAGKTLLMDCVQEQDLLSVDLDQCAEAASLLYACDIPSGLTPGDSAISWTVQFARKALVMAEEYLAEADFELAESTLSSVSQKLGEFEANSLIDPVREQIAQRLTDVRSQKRAQYRLDLYRECSDLVHQVKMFCRHTDLCCAQRESDSLLRRIDQARHRAEQSDPALEEAELDLTSYSDAMPLLSDLPKKVNHHLKQLERADTEQRIKEPLNRLHQLWPNTWDKPVPGGAYAALKQCQVIDAKGVVNDWRSLSRQLDSHQARYYCREAISVISRGKVDDDQVEEILAQALDCDPALAPVAAPIYSFYTLQKLKGMPDGMGNAKADMIEMAQQLLQKEPLGSDAVYSPAVRSDLVREACLLLEKLISAYHGVDSGIDRLWQALETSFAPAFTGGPPEVIREIETLLQACLDACPRHAAGPGVRSDPRNRLRMMLANCHKVVKIAEGEQYLNARQPDCTQAQACFRAGLKTLAKEGVEAADDTRLLQRAVSGCYLAAFMTKDSERMQRHVLDRLEQWLAQTVQDNVIIRLDPEAVLQKVTELQGELEPDLTVGVDEQGDSGPDSALNDTSWPIDMEEGFEASDDPGGG